MDGGVSMRLSVVDVDSKKAICELIFPLLRLVDEFDLVVVVDVVEMVMVEDAVDSVVVGIPVVEITAEEEVEVEILGIGRSFVLDIGGKELRSLSLSCSNLVKVRGWVLAESAQGELAG